MLRRFEGFSQAGLLWCEDLTHVLFDFSSVFFFILPPGGTLRERVEERELRGEEEKSAEEKNDAINRKSRSVKAYMRYLVGA